VKYESSFSATQQSTTSQQAKQQITLQQGNQYTTLKNQYRYGKNKQNRNISKEPATEYKKKLSSKIAHTHW
jgi:hypothetical protein